MEMLSSAKLPPRRLILSYVLDWIVIICIAAVAGGISRTSPNHRPFSLVDPDISFPFVEDEKVSNAVLFVVALVAPGILTFLVALIFAPGPSFSKQVSSSQKWRLKLWEWNAGWMGLALSLATTAVFVEGLKSLVGKPRPDLIARCDPDLTNAAEFVLGGVNDRISEGTLVSWTICRQSDMGTLDDGFKSFPSGHASYAFSGLFYLALYLCSKFAIRIPYLFPTSNLPKDISFDQPDTIKESPLQQEAGSIHEDLRNEGASPPTYLLILPFIPICVAVYISSTRYSDFRHHGFDIISACLIGIVIAWLCFRLYHLPVSRGAGWAWRPRSAAKAYGVGIGVLGYVDSGERRKKSDDLETGNNVNGETEGVGNPGRGHQNH